MKKRRNLATALLLAFSLSVTAGAAAQTLKNIDVYTGVDIYIDGVEMQPTDINGDPVDTFIYNGTTYVPLRAVSEYLGYDVSWDGENTRVYIGEVPGEKQYLLNVCPPYQTNNYYYTDDTDSAYYSIMGNKYANGFHFGYGEGYLGWSGSAGGYAIYNLNGTYDTLSFDVGHIDGKDMNSSTINIYLDGTLAQSIDLNGEMLLTHYDIPLNNALQMKIVGNDYSGRYALVNVEIS